MYNKNPLKFSFEKNSIGQKNSFSRSSTLTHNTFKKGLTYNTFRKTSTYNAFRNRSQIKKNNLNEFSNLIHSDKFKPKKFKKTFNNNLNFRNSERSNHNDYSVKLDIFGNGYKIEKNKNSINPFKNIKQMENKKKKKLVIDRSDFISFIDKSSNNKFYQKNNDYSTKDFVSFKNIGFKVIMNNKKKKTLSDKLKKKFKELKLSFNEFSFFSCNCEIFRFNNEKCFKISKLLKKVNSPSDNEIFKIYKSILTKRISHDCIKQIDKDIKRTFSQSKYFNENNEAYNKLERLLRAISTYKNMGYVQGMNFISASFLWHCEEEYGYYLMIKIFDKLKVEKNFNQNLSGILKHCENFWNLFKQQENEIYEDLLNKGIVPEMILPEWFITIGTIIIPLKFHIILFEQIIFKGWPYFYTVVTHYFKELYKKFKFMDFNDTITIIKSPNKKNIKWIDILGG